MDSSFLVLSRGALGGLKSTQSFLASQGIDTQIVRPPDSDPNA